MTRKDYVLVSKAIAATREYSRKVGDDRNETAYLIGYLSVALQSDNPRFDADHFVEACKAKDNYRPACAQCGFENGEHGTGCATTL